MDLLHRPRRLRYQSNTRDLVQEHQLNPTDLIWPVFVSETSLEKESIPSLPGLLRYPLNEIDQVCHDFSNKGGRAVCLFPKISSKKKNPNGTEATQKDSLIPQAVKRIKEKTPQLTVITDIALDPYTSTGHDGLYNTQSQTVLNDPTVEILSEMATIHAEAGADFVAPSDMMDGRVRAIREKLDQSKNQNTGIISYTAKYASSFYGPFREALDSAPSKGNKKNYQMNPANRKEALHELELDLSEGADIVLVKPGLPYLDIVSLFSQHSDKPTAVYQVSGEYVMIEAAAAQGWLERKEMILESLLCFKRAGADLIFTYYANEVLPWITSTP